jgi:AbiV family abortive infection protein
MVNKKTFDAAVDTILSNAARLLDDATMLEFSEPPTSAIFLTQIAQEELAKAFLLCLVARGIVPWHQHILRATRDHTCKQLLGIVMDHVNPTDELFQSRIRAAIDRREFHRFPRKVADAINILRHEKIGRWFSSSWAWAEDPEYDKEALAVAEGKSDKRKQDVLYVRLGVNGAVASTPQTTRGGSLADEMDRAKRFKSLVESLRDERETSGFDWKDVEETFRLLFSSAYPE